MINKNIILKQGYKPLIISLILVVFLELFITSFLSNIMILITIFIAFVYRNPKKHIFSNTQNILSPIDGKVTAIDYIDNEIKIYCKISLCDTHILRAPENSKLKILKYQKGLNLNPDSYKANLLNEQIVFEFDNLNLKLISGVCNNSIEYFNDKDVLQGEVIGVFLQGIAIITVNKDVDLNINIGDKITSAQSLIFKK